MPVYEYRCRACGARFDVLVRSQDQKVACPKCGAEDLEKLFSVFGIGTPGSPPAAGGG